MRRKYRCWLPCVGLCASVPKVGTLGTCLLKCLILWCQPPVAPGGHLLLYRILSCVRNSISNALMPNQRSQCKGRQENEILESEGTNALSQGPPTHCCALLPISSLVNAKSTLPHPQPKHCTLFLSWAYIPALPGNSTMHSGTGAPPEHHSVYRKHCHHGGAVDHLPPPPSCDLLRDKDPVSQCLCLPSNSIPSYLPPPTQ